MKRISPIFVPTLAFALLSSAALAADVAAESKRANEFFDKWIQFLRAYFIAP